MRTLFLVLMLISLTATAQHTYRGTIVGEGDEPLIGVSIVVPAGNITVGDRRATGAVTDVVGRFEFESEDNSIPVEIRYTGYRGLIDTLKPGEDILLTLAPSTTHLDEVVVVGYARTHKRDVISSVSSFRSAAAAPSARYDAGGYVGGHPERLTEGPAAGQLTAGQLNDFEDYELWKDIAAEDLAQFRDTWRVYADHRYVAQLTYPTGTPAVDWPVQLISQDGEVLWAARTDNQGRAELWRGFTGDDAHQQDRLTLQTVLNGKPLELPTAHTIREGLNFLTLPTACSQPEAIDVAFVIDATGSMGDELSYLSSELQNVAARATDSLNTDALRLAAVTYRDHGDRYLTRHQNFTHGPQATVDFFNKQSASGGGDTPEAVDAGLATALDSLSWNPEATARLLFLVLDATPHEDPASVTRVQALTARAAARGIRLIPVVCSGMNKSGEYLLRSIALATNGTYVFLTDHSGIGNPHLKPTSESYEVEKLNDLLVRLIQEYGRPASCGVTLVASVPLKNTPTEDAKRWTVFPNPTAGPVTVRLPRAKGELHLLSQSAKLLGRYTINRRRQSLNLGSLPAGTYYLRYLHGNHSTTNKIIVTPAN